MAAFGYALIILVMIMGVGLAFIFDKKRVAKEDNEEEY